MLRYKTETRPGLVALYDIWPGNGAGQFLQPRSPHGVNNVKICSQRDIFYTPAAYSTTATIRKLLSQKTSWSRTRQ